MSLVVFTFDSAAQYIETGQTLRDRITKIDQVIDALLLQALNATGTSNISEYSLDDGQTKIRTAYMGLSAIEKAIMDLERLKQMYVRRLNGGGVYKLVDGKSFY